MNTCQVSTTVDGLGAEARRLIGAREGGSCEVSARSARVCAEANWAVTVRARTKYAVAGSSSVIVASSVLILQI